MLLLPYFPSRCRRDALAAERHPLLRTGCGSVLARAGTSHVQEEEHP